MIGMMNSGGDTPVEFYATHKRPEHLQQPSLYRRPVPKATFTYTVDGRHVDNEGNVLEKRSPEEMWQSLIMKMVSTGICRQISVKGGFGWWGVVAVYLLTSDCFRREQEEECEELLSKAEDEQGQRPAVRISISDDGHDADRDSTRATQWEGSKDERLRQFKRAV